MPQYMLSIYVPTDGGLSSEEMVAERPRWYEYTEGLHSSGVFVAGDALHDLETATTVRVRDGETHITDGPFAETKEFLSGYYVIDVPDLDTALQHASGIPSVGRGSVEVRPVVDMTQMPGWQGEAAAQA
jgi:hypothetical protein